METSFQPTQHHCQAQKHHYQYQFHHLDQQHPNDNYQHQQHHQKHRKQQQQQQQQHHHHHRQSHPQIDCCCPDPPHSSSTTKNKGSAEQLYSRKLLPVMLLLSLVALSPLAVHAQEEYPGDKPYSSESLASAARLDFEISHSDADDEGLVLGFGEMGQEWQGEVLQISWEPRLFLLKGFLSEEECDHIIRISTPRLQKSRTLNIEGGKVDTQVNQVRTSTGTLLRDDTDEVTARIAKKTAQVSMIPEENQEPLNVMHYEQGQFYNAHLDYFSDEMLRSTFTEQFGGQRAATLLMYLSSMEEGGGGETVFPDSDLELKGTGWSNCASKGYAVRPRKGDAILFYNLKPTGKPDPLTKHASCPVIHGEKWTATKWIRTFKWSPIQMASKSPRTSS